VQQSSPYHQPSDLDGKTIGVCNSCTVEFYLKNDLTIPGVPTPVDVKNPKIVTYAVEPPGLKALSEGKIDAYFGAEAVGEEAIRQGEGLRALPGNAFTMYLTGFLDKSSSLAQAAFAARIDQIVTHMQRDGELEALSMKYFGKDYGSGAADYSIAQLHQNIPATPTG
jgi:polar amino acid transport system substrate-binding protein